MGAGVAGGREPRATRRWSFIADVTHALRTWLTHFLGRKTLTIQQDLVKGENRTKDHVFLFPAVFYLRTASGFWTVGKEDPRGDPGALSNGSEGVISENSSRAINSQLTLQCS